MSNKLKAAIVSGLKLLDGLTTWTQAAPYNMADTETGITVRAGTIVDVVIVTDSKQKSNKEVALSICPGKGKKFTVSFDNSREAKKAGWALA